MTRCVCTHFHVLTCRQCGCKTFLADVSDIEVGPDWWPSRDSYRYEAVQALRGDVSL
jgi:hypothetical protein